MTEGQKKVHMCEILFPQYSSRVNINLGIEVSFMGQLPLVFYFVGCSREVYLQFFGNLSFGLIIDNPCYARINVIRK